MGQRRPRQSRPHRQAHAPRLAFGWTLSGGPLWTGGFWVEQAFRPAFIRPLVKGLILSGAPLLARSRRALCSSRQWHGSTFKEKRQEVYPPAFLIFTELSTA